MSFPNKGTPSKKTYDKLQGLEVIYIAVCDVMEGNAERFEGLKRNILNVQRGDMLFERIKNAIDDNAKLDIVFISEFGIKVMKIDLKMDNQRKLRNSVFQDRLAAYKILVNSELALIDKFLRCTGKELFKILN